MVRLYNRVGVWLVVCLFATLFITTSSHSKYCPAYHTRPNQMIEMIKMIKGIKKETYMKNEIKIKKETKLEKETQIKKET